MNRADDVLRLYKILKRLEARMGGKLLLKDCDGRMAWPERGVYFFFEDGETRSDGGSGARVVRVGTHALKAGSHTTLWDRLSQHRGRARTDGGNHRGSIFRLLVGEAIRAMKGSIEPRSWGVKGDPGKAAAALGMERVAVRAGERWLEAEVSQYIKGMPFLFVAVEDEPGPQSARGSVERNCIALLSNYGRTPIDGPSLSWLGKHCNRLRVRESGLWNNNHVDESYDPEFFQVLEQMVSRTRSARDA